MSVVDIQKRLNDLGFGPLEEDGIFGPLSEASVREFQESRDLSVDGIVGPDTSAALFGAQGSSAPKTGLKRIIMHWSAGGHKVTSLDKQHYHFIVSGDGEVVKGDKTPEDNISTSDGRYAAHTRSLNTGSIGVSMAAMVGAREAPFTAGSQPITQVQLETFVTLVANLAKEYGIPVTRETILSHAEVQPTLGVAQRGKWDIAWIPGMTRTGNPIEVGDKLREMISEKV